MSNKQKRLYKIFMKNTGRKAMDIFMRLAKLLAVVMGIVLGMTPVSAAEGFFQIERETIEEYFHQATRGFTDTQGHWAELDIYEAVDLGYVSGTSDTEFSPDLPMTRAMLVTLLYRMAGQPAVSGQSAYTDVPQGSWYEKAVLWTVEKGIAYGQTETSFGVTGSATREQIVTMLYRYARVMGYDVSQYASTSGFVDNSSISPASKAAVSWAVAQNLISGKENNRLEPTESATRAEVVSIAIRFLHLIS